MRTDAIDLMIGGSPIRLVCDDPAGIDTLREVFADRLADEPGPVGFAIRTPTPDADFHVLIDRAGRVLVRARSTDDCLAVLGEHLGAWLPRPARSVRLRSRAVVSDDGDVTLVAPPLFMYQPAIERRLARSSQRLVDRLVLDLSITPTAALLTATRTPWSDALARDVVGHSPVLPEPAPISRVVVAQMQHEAPHRADIIAHLASNTFPGPAITERLALAERLADRQVEVVPFGDEGAVYRALVD